MPEEPRRLLQVRLGEDARSGWEACCTDAGVTLTALLEAMGRALGEGRHTISRSVIAEARRIDAERRNRQS